MPTNASVDAVWTKLVTTRTADELAHEVEACGLQRHGQTAMGDHMILAGFENRLRSTIDHLTQVAPLKLSVAPVIGARHAVDHYAVQRLWFEACAGEDLVAVTEHPQPFGPQVRRRFREDMERLFSSGVDHPSARRSNSQWLCGSESQTIVLPHWGALPAFGDPDEEQEAIQAIDRWLSRLP